MTTNTPCQSNKTFQGSKFEDQIFISKPANRKILKEAAKKCSWPVISEKKNN